MRLRNRDLLQQALDEVTDPLHTALEAEYARDRGPNWLVLLGEEKGRKQPVDADDLAGLIDLAIRHWHRFGQRFPSRQVMRHHLGLLKEHRNRLAHRNAGGDWDAAEVIAGLRDVRKVLGPLGSDLDHIDALEAECRRRLAPEPQDTPAPPAPPAPDPDRLDDLSRQLAELTKRIEQQGGPDPRLAAALEEMGSLRRTLDRVASQVSTGRQDAGLDDIREQLGRLERDAGGRASRIDAKTLADALLSMNKQMGDLEPLPPSPPGGPARESPAQPSPSARMTPGAVRSREAAQPRAARTPPAKKAAVRRAAPARHGKRWTDTEDRALLAGWRRGRTIDLLASELQRAPSAVAERLRKEHAVDWLLTATILPEVGQVVSWQGLTSRIDRAARQGARLVLLLRSRDGAVHGCVVDATGGIAVGPASEQDGRYTITHQARADTAIDATRKLERIMGSSRPLEEAAVIHLDLQEPAPDRASRSTTAGPRPSNSELAKMMRSVGSSPSGGAWLVGKYLRDNDRDITAAALRRGVEILRSTSPPIRTYAAAKAQLLDRL